MLGLPNGGGYQMLQIPEGKRNFITDGSYVDDSNICPVTYVADDNIPPRQFA